MAFDRSSRADYDKWGELTGMRIHGILTAAAIQYLLQEGMKKI